MNTYRGLHSVIFEVECCVEATQEGVTKNKRV